MTEESLLTMEEVAVGYDRHVVLQGVNLSIRAGTFTALLGPNGAGKSTLIRTILGVIPPLGGRIRFRRRPDGAEPVMGYVPQRETLDPIFMLSSFEVVLMGACGGLKAGRFPRQQDRAWARHCLEQAGAADWQRRQFSELSGGLKQRVLIARALATRPDFLLLDEPTAGLDPAAAHAIMELLDRLHAEQKLTLLMVNHDLAAVRRHAGEVIWLLQGRILQGTVADLLSRDKVAELLELPLR